MERIEKHQMVIELMEEIFNERKEIETKRNQLLKEQTKESEKELKHLVTVDRKLRNTYEWLRNKSIRLEEEA